MLTESSAAESGPEGFEFVVYNGWNSNALSIYNRSAVWMQDLPGQEGSFAGGKENVAWCYSTG